MCGQLQRQSSPSQLRPQTHWWGWIGQNHKGWGLCGSKKSQWNFEYVPFYRRSDFEEGGRSKRASCEPYSWHYSLQTGGFGLYFAWLWRHLESQIKLRNGLMDKSAPLSANVTFKHPIWAIRLVVDKGQIRQLFKRQHVCHFGSVQQIMIIFQVMGWRISNIQFSW